MPKLTFERIPTESDDEYRWLRIQFPDSTSIYRYRRDEHAQAMRFVLKGLGGFLTRRTRPILVPPSDGDEYISIKNHFFKLADDVYHRAYIGMLGKREVILSPALLLADGDQSVPEYLDELTWHFGRAIRIVPPDAIKKYWGGYLDEFDEIVHYDGSGYHRRRIIESMVNADVYASGIPVPTFLDLLKTHRPDPNMSYESYFEEIHRRTMHGDIVSNPWPQEVLYPKQPRLF